MSLTITAQSLAILPRQTIEAPLCTKFLTADLDPRHNNCLLWSLEETDPDEKPKKEKVEIIMLKLGEALTPQNAKYVSTFFTNSGNLHVFALRESEKLFAVGAAAK
jgi:hypothetical protein